MPNFTGKHMGTYDTAVEQSRKPQSRKPRVTTVTASPAWTHTHAFGIQLGKSFSIEFPETSGHTAEILMLDCEPGGDTFSLMEQGDLDEYTTEEYDDGGYGEDTSFRPLIGLRAVLTLPELDLYIAGLQKMRTRLATINECRGLK